MQLFAATSWKRQLNAGPLQEPDYNRPWVLSTLYSYNLTFFLKFICTGLWEFFFSKNLMSFL